MSILGGWGRGTWSEGAWSEPIPVVLTGVEATGSVGSVSVSGDALVPQSGLQADTFVGSVTVVEGSGVSINVTGLFAGTAINNVTATGGADIPVTGLEATGSVGTVSQRTEAIIPIFPPTPMQSFVAGVVVEADAVVVLTGLQASASTNRVLVWGREIPSSNTVWTEIAA